MPRILFTGGGTAGHVTPNIALLEAARARHWEVAYAGSAAGIEREMIAAVEVPYFAVSSGKLRRYFSWQNFIDPFLIILGIFQSLWVCVRLKPDAVFSKGGFVSVPVVVAAWLLRIPVISHESDVTPGLANRLAYPFCRKICVTFEATLPYLPGDKVIVTGTPVRRSLVNGNASAGLRFLGFSGEKPVLLVFGGSLGAEAINGQVRKVLPGLLAVFDVIHVVGKGNLDPALNPPGYVQRAFISEEFGDVIAAATLVISRAGANSLYELLMTRKPHLLIPLGTRASRGDQLDNARLFSKQGFSQVIHEEDLSDEAFIEAVTDLLARKDEIIGRLKTFDIKDSVSLILDLIEEATHQGVSESL